VVTLLVGTLLEFISLLLFHRVGLNHISLGPSLLIFSILYQYSRIVPAIYTFKIFGLTLSSNSLNYLLGLQLAISRLPGSLAVALIGILTGQIYRSDLAGLKAYRISPGIVNFSQRFILPLIGSLRPPRRTNRALPEEGTTSAGTGANARSTAVQENEEVVTTARRTPRTGRFFQGPDSPLPDLANAVPGGGNAGAGAGAATANANPSVMREWVDELTGRAERAAGVRAPSEDEISQLTAIFPDLDREVLVGALQRRCVVSCSVSFLVKTRDATNDFRTQHLLFLHLFISARIALDNDAYHFIALPSPHLNIVQTSKQLWRRFCCRRHKHETPVIRNTPRLTDNLVCPTIS
jgi:hypothetical protein